MSVSMIPWVGGKEKLLWIIDLLAPAHYSRFIDVFGGSGTVTLSRPLRPGCMEVYNDINGDLVNLFKCVRDRPLAMLNELGFLPLHSHEEFDVLLKFFDQEEFTNEYLQEEMELAQRFFPPEQSEELCKRMLARAQLGDVRRAAAYFKRIRGSFSGGGKSFAGKPCDIRHFFHLIWECSRRLKDVVIENRDFSPLTFQYDRPDALFYYDPPYYDAERCYEAVFTKEDHIRLHRVARECKGYVMVSYNCCEYIRELYQDFFIFHTKRPNSMSQTEGSEYEEYVLTNYDPSAFAEQTSLFGIVPRDGKQFELIHRPDMILKTS